MESHTSVRHVIWKEVQAHGLYVCTCPTRFAAFLLQWRLSHLAVCRPLLESVRCEIPSELMRLSKTPILLRCLLPQLINGLEQKLAVLRKEQIYWIVETWAMTVGLTPYREAPYPSNESGFATGTTSPRARHPGQHRGFRHRREPARIGRLRPVHPGLGWSYPSAASMLRRSHHADGCAYRSLAFSPDGHYLAAAEMGDTVALWDKRTWTIAQRFHSHSEAEDIWAPSVAFDHAGTTLAVGGAMALHVSGIQQPQPFVEKSRPKTARYGRSLSIPCGMNSSLVDPVGASPGML